MSAAKIARQFETLTNRVDCDDLARAKPHTLSALKSMCMELIAAVDAEVAYRQEHQARIVHWPLVR